MRLMLAFLLVASFLLLGCNQPCGGVQGWQCPEGFECDYSNAPAGVMDARGECVSCKVRMCEKGLRLVAGKDGCGECIEITPPCMPGGFPAVPGCVQQTTCSDLKTWQQCEADKNCKPVYGSSSCNMESKICTADRVFKGCVQKPSPTPKASPALQVTAVPSVSAMSCGSPDQSCPEGFECKLGERIGGRQECSESVCYEVPLFEGECVKKESCPQFVLPSPNFEEDCVKEGGRYVEPKKDANGCPGKPQCITDEKACKTNKDCSCGVHVTTGECFLGNAKYVDETRQCPDFCTGFTGGLRVSCVNNVCKHV